MRTPGTATRRYLALLAAGVLVCVLGWVAFARDVTVREVTVAESAEGATFTPKTTMTVTGIGLCLDGTALPSLAVSTEDEEDADTGSDEADVSDAAADETLSAEEETAAEAAEMIGQKGESYLLTGTAHLVAQDLRIPWEGGFSDLEIPILEIRELSELVSEPFELEAGETYKLLIFDGEQNVVSGMTWAFYGESHGLGALYAVMCAGALALLSLLYWSVTLQKARNDAAARRSGRRRSPAGVSAEAAAAEERAYGNGRAGGTADAAAGREAGRWMSAEARSNAVAGGLRVPSMAVWAVLIVGCSLLLSVLSFCILPEDEDGFRAAYALSGQFLEKFQEDEAISSLIPSGVLRAAGSADAQSLSMFFSGGDYGNVQLEAAAAYTAGASQAGLRSLFPALGLTLVRLLGASWQWYLVIPRLCNALLWLAAALIAMKICPRLRGFLGVLSLLPSTLLLVNSCSQTVWNLALCVLAVSLCARGMRQWKGRQVRESTEGGTGHPDERGAVRGRSLLPAAAAAAVVVIALFPLFTAFLDSGAMEMAGETWDTISAFVWSGQHPWLAFLVFVNTIFQEGGTLAMKTLLGESTWQAVPVLPALGMAAALAVCAAGCLYDSAEEDAAGTADSAARGRHLAAAILLIGAFAVMALTMFDGRLGTTVQWNDGMTITGMQGRDFLVLLAALPFALPASRRAGQYAGAAACAAAALAVISIPLMLGSLLAGM